MTPQKWQASFWWPVLWGRGFLFACDLMVVMQLVLLAPVQI